MPNCNLFQLLCCIFRTRKSTRIKALAQHYREFHNLAIDDNLVEGPSENDENNESNLDQDTPKLSTCYESEIVDVKSEKELNTFGTDFLSKHGSRHGLRNMRRK